MTGLIGIDDGNDGSKGKLRMSKVVTYKDDPSGCFCQIKFDSGERILISMVGPPIPNIKIFKLLLGNIPIRTLWSLSSHEVGGVHAYVNLLMKIFAENEQEPIPRPLEAITDKLIAFGSIKEAIEAIQKAAL
jgi:hypothetical protein